MNPAHNKNINGENMADHSLLELSPLSFCFLSSDHIGCSSQSPMWGSPQPPMLGDLFL